MTINSNASTGTSRPRARATDAFHFRNVTIVPVNVVVLIDDGLAILAARRLRDPQ